MKHFKLFFCVLCAILLASCEEDPKGITLTEGQKSEVQTSYDSTSSSIEFEAAADWTATVTPVQRSSEIDWLHLDQTSGSAGTITLSFTMDSNYTGERRSACIVITCNDSSISVVITQFPEGEEPDNDEGNGDDDISQDESMERPIRTIMMNCDSYSFVNGEDILESSESIRLNYSRYVDGSCYPDYMIVETYDALEDERYSSRWSIECSESSLSAWTLEENGSKHNATLKDGKVVAGSYSFYDDVTAANYAIEYDNDGWISKSTSEIGGSYTFNWTDGNMMSISNAHAGTGTFTYSEYQMPRISSVPFNFNWLLLHDELADFSVGDPSKIWAMLGYLGQPSRNLMATYTSPDGISTDVEYVAVSDYRMECIVVEWRAGEAITRTEWTLDWHGF